MGRIGTAFRSFFRVLGDKTLAERVRLVLDGEAPVAEPVKLEAPRIAEPVKKAPLRSEALTMLSVLQREARLVDFLKENIAAYDDAQVGAAVREIHRDALAALDRIFELRPVQADEEGASISVPAGYDAGRIRLTGNVSGSPPHIGTLAHAGWEATKVELPEWNGTDGSAKVIAPAEVEIK